MATNQKKLIDWNGDAKALLRRVEGSIEAIEEGDLASLKVKRNAKTLAWLKDIKQILLTCNDIEFLGLMMNRYAEPLIYAAVEALDCVMDSVQG